MVEQGNCLILVKLRSRNSKFVKELSLVSMVSMVVPLMKFFKFLVHNMLREKKFFLR